MFGCWWIGVMHRKMFGCWWIKWYVEIERCFGRHKNIGFKEEKSEEKVELSDDDSGTDSKAKSSKQAYNQTNNQDNRVGSSDDAQPRTSKKKECASACRLKCE